MKQRFLFVTSNDHKVATARHVCDEMGIAFRRENIDLTEIQSDDGEVVARGKAEQAYEHFLQPVVITDDNWLIPGLNGFPGPYMKYVNQWFKPDDFIRLTKDLDDRRIIMRQIIVYKDKDQEKVFPVDIEGVLLKEALGSSIIPHFAVISFNGGKHSVAEADAKSSNTAVAQRANAWHDLCAWLSA